MKRAGRALIWIVGGVLALGSLILLAVNLYVQSQGTHHRIQQELSQRLQTPLRIRQISVTPWGGLKLSGIVIPQEQQGLAGDFLHADTFQLRVEFWSLFSRRLIIRQVSLVRPTILWPQNSAGKWRLPSLPRPSPSPPPPRVASATTPLPGPITSEQNAASSANPSLPSTTAQPSTSSPNEPKPVDAGSAPFTPEVRRVNLKKGDFTFLDSTGKLVARFSGLNFSSAFRTATAIKGDASVDLISLRDRFFIQHLHSPLRYDPTELEFSSITAEAAGGQLSGKFEMHLQAQGSPFTARVNFQQLEATKLLENAGGPSAMISGRLEGFLDASGKTADPNALAGKGEIVLRDGKVQQYSLLVALGQILQINDLMQLQFQQARIKYHITPGLVTIDELLLRSPNIQLSANGTINFKGKMRLRSQLALSEQVRRKLFAPIRDNFQPVNSPEGYAAIDFKVTGTVDRPRTDLMQKVIGKNLGDLGGVISSLLGGSKNKKPREQSEATPSPTPSPEQSPAVISPSPTPTPNPSLPGNSVSPMPAP